MIEVPGLILLVCSPNSVSRVESMAALSFVHPNIESITASSAIFTRSTIYLESSFRSLLKHGNFRAIAFHVVIAN